MFDKEAFFIHLLEQSGATKGIGDDCVILQNHKTIYPRTHKARISAKKKRGRYLRALHKGSLADSLVVGMDSFCENVHFLQEWFSPYTLAYKALLVNYSDIIAMNATPAYAMLSITLPYSWGKSEIQKCVLGISDFCQKFGVFIIGGDTISAVSLQFHITFFGFTSKHTIYRDRIPLHSVLYATCDRYPSKTISQSLKVLKNLLNNHKSRDSKNMLKAKGRFLKPQIRAEFVRDCAKFLKGGLDISDGIVQEIKRVCAINHCGFKSFLPLFSPSYRALLQGGEVYEMLLAISPKDVLRLHRWAMRHRIKLLKLGVLRRRRTLLPPHTLWH